MSEQLLRVPEVARQLGIDGPEAYMLIQRGELEAGKGHDGLVYVQSEALAKFQGSRAPSEPL